MFKAEGAERNESFCAEYAALFNAIIAGFENGKGWRCCIVATV